MAMDMKDVVSPTVVVRRSGANRQRASVSNPEMVWQSAMEKIHALYGRLQVLIGFSDKDFNDYIKLREPQLWVKINTAWETVDGDVYGRFLDGRLSSEEFSAWKIALHNWIELMQSAVELYGLHRLSSVSTDRAFSCHAA